MVEPDRPFLIPFDHPPPDRADLIREPADRSEPVPISMLDRHRILDLIAGRGKEPLVFRQSAVVLEIDSEAYEVGNGCAMSALAAP